MFNIFNESVLSIDEQYKKELNYYISVKPISVLKSAIHD